MVERNALSTAVFTYALKTSFLKAHFIFFFSASLFDLDTDELDRLEIELAAAEQALQDADLDDQFNKLTTTNNQVKKWVADYRLDISDLEADVENVREIMESLPTGCFKNIEIETPTAQ